MEEIQFNIFEITEFIIFMITFPLLFIKKIELKGANVQFNKFTLFLFIFAVFPALHDLIAIYEGNPQTHNILNFIIAMPFIVSFLFFRRFALLMLFFSILLHCLSLVYRALFRDSYSLSDLAIALGLTVFFSYLIIIFLKKNYNFKFKNLVGEK